MAVQTPEQNLDEILKLTNVTETFLTNKIKHSQDYLEKQFKKAKPSEVRSMSESLRTSLEGSMEINNNIITKMNDVKRKLETIETLTSQHTDILNEVLRELNKKQIGTLEGLARDAIARGRIRPQEGDIIARSVLEQHYDELEAMNRGGKTKKKTRKNKRTRKARKIRN